MRIACLALLLTAQTCLTLSAQTSAGASPATQLPPLRIEAKPTDHMHVSYRLKYIVWGPIHSAAFDQIDPRSPAGKAGIATGTPVVLLNDVPVKGMTEAAFQAVFDSGKPVRFGLPASEGTLRTVVVSFPPHFWKWDRPSKANGSGKASP